MTPEQIAKAREIIADYRYGNAYDFRPLVAQALDYAEHMETMFRETAVAYEELQEAYARGIAENERLQSQRDELSRQRDELDLLNNKLRAENDELVQEAIELHRENKKLMAVAEAAEKCIVDETMPFYEAKEIIKAWRGE